MAITVNTNTPSLTAQSALNKATSKMNTAMERMSTGYRINSSKDDAAGLAVSNKLEYQMSSFDVAQDNAQMGASMLDTVEGVMGTITDNLTRIRDLTEQAANGTYGSDAMTAIKTEINARLEEIDRVANSTEFNGKALLNGKTGDVNLQVGIKNDNYSIITLKQGEEFVDATKTGLGLTDASFTTDTKAREYLDSIDKAIETVTKAQTKIGGKQAAISSAIESANVMQTNLTSANSLIKDADIAEESSNYVKQQILQQTSASLLATANQAPSIALNLV